MRLLVATRSAGKQPEFRRMLERAGHEVVFPDDLAIGELPEEGTLESADSFEGNARRKAEYFQRKGGLPTLADDSGLEVLSLGGAPGVRSKRWAGATGTAAEIDAANNAELLRRLRGAPAVKRSARYRCVLVLISTVNAVPQVFEGSVAGRMLEEPRGMNGFGYDPFFWSAELGKTFGEATAEEKDRVSHRGRALAELIGVLR
ncbi:MAG: non-canonical purine NTP pyrophosphatase [Gemmatimonadales bacterium]